MKVHELIAHLKGMPRDAYVVTPGFDESDIDDVQPPRLIRIVRGSGGGGHCGEHKEAEHGAGEPAVLINW